MSSIGNNSNWTVSNSRIDKSNWPSSFTVNSSTGPDNPSNFTASPGGTDNMDLSWSKNAAGDNVMVAYNTTNTFGTPSDGTSYAAGNAITGGGTVIYNGSGVTYNHTGLAAGTHYYYKAWSVDGSNNYSSGVTSDATTIPKILITEVMQNPSDVTDANGEWFEIYNYGTSTVNINGYVIKDGGSDSHTINNGGALNIAAGSFLVLGINSTVSSNGGVPVDYQYTGITLGNGDDEVILYMQDGTTEVDRVEWDGGTNWPDPTGASMIFTGQPTDDNNNGSNWTTSVKRENNFSNPGGTETDKGSPGKNGLYQNLISTTTWSGTGNWSDGNGVGNANWSNGSPGNKTSVIIDGTVTIDAGTDHPAKSKDLTINSGKSVSIPTGKALTVNGNLTNNGTLTVQSDASGNGSLIVHGTATGNITVQRYIKKFTTNDITVSGNGWHEIGCPVTSFSVLGTDWDPTTTGTKNDLYYWDESQNLWMNYRSSSFNFSPQKGYLVANDADLTHEFTGTPNTSDVTVSNLSYTSGKGEGWHLLGNPYPSAIKWNDGNWTLTNVGGTAEIWNETSGSYTPVNANEIIPSTNGFFVQVAANHTGSVTIPADARVHDATNNYKEIAATPKETLTFKITDDANNYFDKSILGFKPNATEDWDMAFDAHKLMSLVKTAPQIWTVSKDQHFLVNYIPETASAYDVPLHFKPGVSTVYHLSVKGVDSFNGTSFVLEDLKTGNKIDLGATKEYDFSAEKGDDVNRFVLHINGVTAVPGLNATDGLHIFSYGKTIYLNAQKALSGKVSVFNMLGQRVYESNLNGTNKQQIQINQKRGIYFVRVEKNESVVTRKVFIQ